MKIYITGDKSRYQYLKKLLGVSSIKECFSGEQASGMADILISNSLGTDEKLKSYKIPLNTEVIIAGDIQNTNLLMKELDRYDRILIFDEFPYRTEAELDRTESITNNYKVNDYEIVLVQKEGNALKSDISTADDALLQAKKDYESEGHKVRTYSTLSNNTILDFSKNKFRGKIKNGFVKRLQKARENLDNFDWTFMLEYQGYLKDMINDPKRLNGYIRYERIKDGELRDTFINGFMKDFFWDNEPSKVLKIFIEKVYREFTEEISVWNVEVDISRLYSEIGIIFSEKLYRGKRINFFGDEADYVTFRNKNDEIIVGIKQSAISFFESELPEIIKQRILHRIEKLEELLNVK